MAKFLSKKLSLKKSKKKKGLVTLVDPEEKYQLELVDKEVRRYYICINEHSGFQQFHQVTSHDTNLLTNAPTNAVCDLTSCVK